jgi:solute carrier family 25 S-adenosylmethionine transporter 26
LIRVPADNIRQRAQVNAVNSTFEIFKEILRKDGMRGFYRSYLTTLLREIPFGSIQFPLWEYLKVLIQRRRDGKCEPYQSAVCGAIAG